MSEMIERIAREVALEIVEIHNLDDAALFKWPDDVNGDTADRARSRAERIIEAMREPTEAMAEACDRACFAQGGGAIVVRPVYEAMIDAALTTDSVTHS